VPYDLLGGGVVARRRTSSGAQWSQENRLDLANFQPELTSHSVQKHLALSHPIELTSATSLRRAGSRATSPDQAATLASSARGSSPVSSHAHRS
jgi:hypothetical protein